MNKTELVEAIAKKAEISKKDAEAALNAMTEAIGKALKKGDKVQLVGFGTFETVKRAARTGEIPRPEKRSRSQHPRLPNSRPERLSRIL